MKSVQLTALAHQTEAGCQHSCVDVAVPTGVRLETQASLSTEPKRLHVNLQGAVLAGAALSWISHGSHLSPSSSPQRRPAILWCTSPPPSKATRSRFVGKRPVAYAKALPSAHHENLNPWCHNNGLLRTEEHSLSRVVARTSKSRTVPSTARDRLPTSCSPQRGTVGHFRRLHLIKGILELHRQLFSSTPQPERMNIHCSVSQRPTTTYRVRSQSSASGRGARPLSLE